MIDCTETPETLTSDPKHPNQLRVGDDVLVFLTEDHHAPRFDRSMCISNAL
jgi:hypothetical protein